MWKGRLVWEGDMGGERKVNHQPYNHSYHTLTQMSLGSEYINDYTYRKQSTMYMYKTQPTQKEMLQV